MNDRSKSTTGFVILALVLFALATPRRAASQLADPFSQLVLGVVHNEGGGSINGYRVELSNSGGWEKTSTDVQPDGSFRIPMQQGVAGQQYILRVVDGKGQVVHDDIVRPDAAPLEIYVSAQRGERPVSGVISLEQLRNPPPKQAMKQYQRAQKAMQKGDVARAIRRLNKAIEIHPQFVEAHNSLGVKYMRLGNYARAASAFEEALRLKPDAAQPLSNLGVAYHGLQRYDQAEELIRASLKLRPGAPKTRFSLALVLLTKGEREAEAVEILLDVADQVPQSHLCMATYLEGQTKYGAAAREVAAYLETEDQQYREMAKQWIGRLEAAARHPESAAIH